MYNKKYKSTINNIRLHQNNIYNVHRLNLNLLVKLESNFNSFGGEKNLKLSKLYFLLNYLSNQKPVLKNINFKHLKKKILKIFNISVSLSRVSTENFLSYFFLHYIHFFQIYYQNMLKYNYSKNCFIFHIDNIQFFFKNYNKQNQRTQLKVFLKLSNLLSKNELFVFLSHFFIVKLRIRKTNEISINKK